MLIKKAVVDRDTPSILTGKRGQSVDQGGESVDQSERDCPVETLRNMRKNASAEHFEVNKTAPESR